MNRYSDMTIWQLREELKVLQAELASRDLTPRAQEGTVRVPVKEIDDALAVLRRPFHELMVRDIQQAEYVLRRLRDAAPESSRKEDG